MTRTKRLNLSFPKRPFSKWLGWAVLTIATALLIGAFTDANSGIYQSLQAVAFWLGETYERWFQQQAVSNPIVLIGMSFLGGLIASVSPCILSLLPVNLSYIGTREIVSRRDAVVKAGSFVLGVVTVLSLLGLFSSLAGVVLIRFRGYFHVAVGALIGLMGLNLMGWLRLPLLPKLGRSGPEPLRCAPQPDAQSQRRFVRFITGPYSVGLTFALVSSPCTSPVMFAVLTAAAATGSQLQSTLAMIAYALGYTMVIFLASLLTGFAKQTRGLLKHAETITRVASLALLLVGGFYVVNGLRWIWAIVR